MSKRRVVVTGLGAVTPIGNNVEDFWAGIREGKVGIGPITKFDTTDYKVKIAAEVKDFNAKDHMDPRAARRMDPFCQYAVTAAKEAFEDAGLDMEKEDSFRVGVIVGSGIGSLPQVENNYEKILTKGPGKVNPLMVPMMISNMAAGNISIQLGLRGKCTDVVTACASGTHSIGDAFRAIQYGDAEVMLAGGTESCICPTGMTFTPAAFQSAMYFSGLPAPVVTTLMSSSRITFAILSASGFISMMFTPNGLSVSFFVSRICSLTHSAGAPPAAISPRPPALDTAAAR